ncbi:MAG TPA: hypothetical protein VL475_15675 [Planctomycetaceae bacterium]|nr:hypothetical protein [Planctomycetaceae bacterium]
MTSRISSDLLRHVTSPSAGTVPTRFTGDDPTPVVAESLTVCHPQVETTGTVDAADEVFVPDHYEANYAYPLLVWLVPEAAPKGNLKTLMRRISERNSFGAVVRVNGDSALDDRLVRTVAGLRRRYHIHSERVYLAGSGTEATQALALGLARPEWFGGIVALSPHVPLGPRMLSQFDALRGKRVFLATTEDDRQQIDRLQKMQRLLWSAGLSVRACTCDAPEQDDNGLLREIDRWMIQAIEEAATVA